MSLKIILFVDPLPHAKNIGPYPIWYTIGVIIMAIVLLSIVAGVMILKKGKED